MESKQYLPVGFQLGGHYEIIEVLGEDDFEILYLVKDTHRLQTMFVIKELFLKNISLRTQDHTIHTLEHSKYIFEETKKELVVEAQKLQTSNYQKDKIQTYGYFEENNTIYIIMEFVNDTELNNYLNIQPKKENKVIPPSVKEEYELKQERPKSTFFLKILIGAVFIFIGLGVYAYQMIEEDKQKAKEKPTVVVVKNTPMQHPELTNRNRKTQENTNTSTTINRTQEENKEEIQKSLPSGAEYIHKNKEEVEEVKQDNNPFDTIPNDEIYIDNEVEEIEEEPEFQVPYVAPPAPSVSLGTKIETPQHQANRSHSLGTPIQQNIPKKTLPKFTRASIEQFLNRFIDSSSTGSVESIASHYDYHVDQYFSLRNITHTKIKDDKRRYNTKWTDRNFEIINFYIIRKYQRDGTEYCDIKTKTRWNVSTENGKYRSGISRGFMSLKSTDQGFKVKSIYTLK